MWGLPQKQNARRAYKIRLCGHLRRYKKIVKKTYIIYNNYKNESKILIANRDFLLSRDLTIITIMLIIIYFILIGLKIIVFSKTIVTVMLIELIVSNISMRGKATRLAYNVISEDIYK